MIEIEGIHIARDSDNVVVEVSVEGLWYPVISEVYSDNLDNYVTAENIDTAIFAVNLDLLKN